MGADLEVVAGLAGKFAELRPHLDELRWRLYLGSEARAYAEASGCGLAAAAAVVAGAAGVSRATVMSGAEELAAGAEPMPGRSRRPGAGRKKLEERDRGLAAALQELLAAGTRGDPVSPLVWTTLSVREIAAELARQGHRCGKDAVARMLRAEGYSLQGMSRTIEGRQHPDRDAQFRHISAMIAEFGAAGDPVVSVDAKKKEQLGPFHRDGRGWRPGGSPVRVRDHDFPDEQLGKITPYGVYDIAANRGFVSVGTSCDTAAFAVNALRLWWQREGSLRYPGVRRLLVTCDAGGSNGYRCRLWKDQLAVLAAGTGLQITVCHFPPGTSKWNKIEHRLFCHITRTWRARPLMTKQDAVAGIAATVTGQGLKCTAVLDDADYPGGVKISDERMSHLENRILDRQDTRGAWNYAIRPAPAAAPPPPAPAPAPAPDLAALAALAGISDFGALLAAVAVPCQAAREQRLYLDRGGARHVPSGPAGPIRLPSAAAVAAAACHHRAGLSYRLLGQLLGVHASTVSLAASYINPVLAQHGITPRYQRARIRTHSELREHATASGVPITAITIQAPQPDTNTTDTPEKVN
jgi:transposase